MVPDVVDYYVFEVYAAGSDPGTAAPVPSGNAPGATTGITLTWTTGGAGTAILTWVSTAGSTGSSQDWTVNWRR